MKLSQFSIFVNYKPEHVEEAVQRLCNFPSVIWNRDCKKVNDVRELIRLSSALSSSTLFLIAQADEMTVPAQNALLKLAEEPPKFCYIVLVTNNPEKLLPTIRSRALTYINRRAVMDSGIEDNKDMLELAEKVFANLSNISYTNTFNIIKHVEKEMLPVFLATLRAVWEDHYIESNLFKELVLITKYQVDVKSGTNMERHIKTLLQELKEMREKCKSLS